VWNRRNLVFLKRRIILRSMDDRRTLVGERRARSLGEAGEPRGRMRAGAPCGVATSRDSEWPLARFLEPEVVRQDHRVVEGEGGGKVRLAEQACLGGVVAAKGRAFARPT